MNRALVGTNGVACLIVRLEHVTYSMPMYGQMLTQYVDCWKFVELHVEITLGALRLSITTAAFCC